MPVAITIATGAGSFTGGMLVGYLVGRHRPVRRRSGELRGHALVQCPHRGRHRQH
jgi:hypothetical protein